MQTGPLLLEATVAGPGGSAGPAPKGLKTVQGYVSGAGAVAAVMRVEVSSMDPAIYASSWVIAATFNLSGTNVATDAVSLEGPFAYWRAYLVSISGTGAKASIWVNQ